MIRKRNTRVIMITLVVLNNIYNLAQKLIVEGKKIIISLTINKSQREMTLRTRLTI